MTKIMLVEDDNSLREIYSIRLTAEGYTIVSAGDGEEALAMAVRERPDLIISDVMMPKISGFDMLDILRSTPETKDIKVIMMTALSSEDQRSRGENLGADRYLVKSQVGIEDVVNTVHDVLGDRNADGTINPTAENSTDGANVGNMTAPAAEEIASVEVAEPAMEEAANIAASAAANVAMSPAEGELPVMSAAPMQAEAAEQVAVPPVMTSEAPAMPDVIDNPADLGVVDGNTQEVNVQIPQDGTSAAQ